MAQIDIQIKTLADLKAFSDTIAASRNLKAETDKVGHGIGGLRDETDKTLHHIERAFSGSRFSHGFLAAMGIGSGAAAFEHLVEKFGELWRASDEWMRKANEQAEKMAATFERLAKVRFDNSLGGMTSEQQVEALKRQREELQARADLQERIRAESVGDISKIGTIEDKNQFWAKYGVPMMQGGQFTGAGTLAEAMSARADAAQQKRVELDTQLAEIQKRIADAEKQVTKEREESSKKANEAGAAEIKTALAAEDAERKADGAAEAALDSQAEKWINANNYLMQHRLDVAEIEKLWKAGKFTVEEYQRALEQAERTFKDAQAADINKRLTDFFGEEKGNKHPERSQSVLERSQNAAAGLKDPTQHLQGGVAEGAQVGILDYMARAGTMADQVAQGIQSTLGAAVQSISQGITGWIMGVQSFGQMLANIASTILQTVLQTIVEIGVKMLVNAILGRVLAAAAAKFAIGVAVAAAAPLAEAWAIPATLSTIASSGATAVAAPGEIAAAVATVAGAGLFEEGGFTGPGGRGDIAGLVHAGEWVAPAWMVNSPGFGGLFENLETMRTGGVSSIARPAYAPVTGPASPAIHIYADHADFARAMQEHSGDWFVSMANKWARGSA